MKKIISSMLFFGIATFVMAQDKGMHFEHNTSWEKVLVKAKAENKYIFVDCFTTWCGPCKMMSSTIFPLEEVGTFYNKNFINVKIQLDTTKNDNEEVKSWFAAGKEIATKYRVQAYPTYLMFNPNGEIVHRAVGSSDATAFLAKGADAMNPDKQYYTLKREYEAGKKGDAFLYKVAKAAADAYDMQFAKKVTDEYLATQTNLYTKENLELLQMFTRTSKDPGFAMMLNNPEKVDAVLGKGVSESAVQRIILQEEVFPALFQNGATLPDWAAIEKNLKEKYPAQANQALLYSKVVYAQQKKNWNDFGPAVVAYMKSYGDDASPEQMNNFAWTIFENCDDMACVESALTWSKQSFANNDMPAFIDTYANLLYKMGKKNEAIEWETKAKEFAIKSGEDPKGYEAVIDKMQKGEKTW
jgi:thiol-disulfide isomerase/thioredoxin